MINTQIKNSLSALDDAINKETEIFQKLRYQIANKTVERDYKFSLDRIRNKKLYVSSRMGDWDSSSKGIASPLPLLPKMT